MIRLVDSVASMRPDAVTVWRDPEVNRRLFWYRHVMTSRFPTKFILCRKIPTGMDLVTRNPEKMLTSIGIRPGRKFRKPTATHAL